VGDHIIEVAFPTCRPVSLGLGRDGSISGNGSGDIFIASPPRTHTPKTGKTSDHQNVAEGQSRCGFFAATVQAVEESIINAMIAAETMTGIENHKVMALQHDQLRAVRKKYNRLTDQ
jgi:D-aminopeptidase